MSASASTVLPLVPGNSNRQSRATVGYHFQRAPWLSLNLPPYLHPPLPSTYPLTHRRRGCFYQGGWLPKQQTINNIGTLSCLYYSNYSYAIFHSSTIHCEPTPSTSSAKFCLPTSRHCKSPTILSILSSVIARKPFVVFRLILARNRGRQKWNVSQA